METIRLTTAGAIVRYLIAQRSELEGGEVPLFPGVFAIFGHGNVTCLGEALEGAKDRLPTWRGQNEQSMAMAAIAFAKAKRRRQIMVATSSIGPGALNMVTAAGIAHANRLPVLLLSGDTFVNRVPDPVLQQVEPFGDPSVTVNDAFRPVTRYWDRIVHPAQLLQSLPQAVATMLDPAECGPAFLGLPQDVQAEAYDFPAAFFEPRAHRIRRPGPDPGELTHAAEVLRAAERPLLIAGGGVHYSLATEELAAFAETHGVPVVETVAGKSSLPMGSPAVRRPDRGHGELLGERPRGRGRRGPRGRHAPAGLHDRLLERLRRRAVRLIALNAARHDVAKHLAVPLVADARRGLQELDAALADWRAPSEWRARATREYAAWNDTLDEAAAAPTASGLPSYAAVIRRVNDLAGPDDYALAAAGGLPGELNKHWRSLGVGTFDCEYGFSCMGYEIGGAWGAAMAMPERTVLSFCGDGSYLMSSADVYGSVLAGHRFVLILCDNEGYAVIDRLQVFTGGASFNNMLEDVRGGRPARVDFAKHAEAMGAWTETVDDLDGLEDALQRARAADRTAVIVIRTDPHAWTGGDAWWDVGVPEVSDRDEVRVAKAAHEAGRKHQRPGV